MASRSVRISWADRGRVRGHPSLVGAPDDSQSDGTLRRDNAFHQLLKFVETVKLSLLFH